MENLLPYLNIFSGSLQVEAWNEGVYWYDNNALQGLNKTSPTFYSKSCISTVSWNNLLPLK